MVPNWSVLHMKSYGDNDCVCTVCYPVTYCCCDVIYQYPQGAALPENNDATAELTTAIGGTFTSSSARLSSQSRYSTSNFYKRI